MTLAIPKILEDMHYLYVDKVVGGMAHYTDLTDESGTSHVLPQNHFLTDSKVEANTVYCLVARDDKFEVTGQVDLNIASGLFIGTGETYSSENPDLASFLGEIGAYLGELYSRQVSRDSTG